MSATSKTILKKKKGNFKLGMGMIMLEMICNTAHSNQISPALLQECKDLLASNPSRQEIWEKLITMSRMGDDKISDTLRVFCRVDDFYEIKKSCH